MHANISGCYQLFIQNLPHTIRAAVKTEIYSMRVGLFQDGHQIIFRRLILNKCLLFEWVPCSYQLFWNECSFRFDWFFERSREDYQNRSKCFAPSQVRYCSLPISVCVGLGGWAGGWDDKQKLSIHMRYSDLSGFQNTYKIKTWWRK